MTEKLTTYDPASALVDDTEIAFFMAEALETGDASYIAKCVGVVARAKGMAGIAEETGLIPRTTLSLFQRRRQSNFEVNTSSDEGAWD